jgi:hypothetical protein
MMATYIGFSLVFMHSLHKLGNTFSEQEEKGLFHLWKYVGYLLGIPENLLPDDKKQATQYFYLWTSIQPPADKDSVLLAHSLLNDTDFSEKIYVISIFAALGFYLMKKSVKDCRFRKFPTKMLSRKPNGLSIKFTIQ